jgi:hypothetical protein
MAALTAPPEEHWVAPKVSSGLGNRLFQFAAAAGAARRWGRRAVFFLPRCSGSPHGAFNTIFRMFPSVEVINTAPTWTELQEPPRRFYEHIPLGAEAPAPGAIVIAGYRQSPEYFTEIPITPDWASALGPGGSAAIEAEAGLETAAERGRTVALHVRLGDYLNLPHHQQDLSWYYVEALKHVPAGSRIHLFSDEPEKCLEYFKRLIGSFEGLTLTVAKKRSDVEGLYEFSCCLGGTICANSTYSWWGAYFAHARGAAWATVPSHWGQGQPEPVDLFCSWMRVIDVEAPVALRSVS